MSVDTDHSVTARLDYVSLSIAQSEHCAYLRQALRNLHIAYCARKLGSTCMSDPEYPTFVLHTDGLLG